MIASEPRVHSTELPTIRTIDRFGFGTTGLDGERLRDHGVNQAPSRPNRPYGTAAITVASTATDQTRGRSRVIMPLMTSTPRPRLAPMNSPNTAPRTDAAAPIWKPVRTAGSADLSRTYLSPARGPPPHALIIVREEPSAERRPSTVPTSVVKNTDSAASTTRAVSGGNVSCSSGITATSGRQKRVRASLSTSRSTAANCTNRMPKTIATRLPQNQPRTPTHAVARKAVKYSSGLDTRLSTIARGEEMTPSFVSPASATICQASSRATETTAVLSQLFESALPRAGNPAVRVPSA